jgi:hypothetical protein
MESSYVFYHVFLYIDVPADSAFKGLSQQLAPATQSGPAAVNDVADDGQNLTESHSKSWICSGCFLELTITTGGLSPLEELDGRSHTSTAGPPKRPLEMDLETAHPNGSSSKRRRLTTQDATEIEGAGQHLPESCSKLSVSICAL